MGLSATQKSDLLAYASNVVIIATPATSQAQLDTVLTQAADGVITSAFKGPKLGANINSVLNTSAAVSHANLLPSLLAAHANSTLGFDPAGISAGGKVIARSGSTTGTPTAVQWVTPKRVVTLLGYWIASECELSPPF